MIRGKQARVWAAVRAGAETIRDVEAVVTDLSSHQIAAHLSNLKRHGRIEVIGRAGYLSDRGARLLVNRYRARPA